MRFILSFVFILFFLGCGNPNQILLESSADSVSEYNFNSANTSNDSSCQDFAKNVLSFRAGNGGEFGQESLPDIVLGPPKGAGSFDGSLDVVSLGEGGEIILDVRPCTIVDKEGPDFIVFENAFFVGGNEETPFKELGIVGVSMDGMNFTDFPCHTQNFPYTGCAGWHPVYSNPNNHISPFDMEQAGGDPFDLSEMNITQARFIRIRAIGRGGFFPSVGFDLDAIAVVNGENK